jgi:hypothetical protein
MKRIFTLLALATFALTIFAQSPDLMTYQAVLRDAENHLLTNQAVAVQISILQTTPNGTAVYTEIHTLSTNANGLVSLVIGDGVTGDDLSTIDWSSGPYFLKTETDPAGGSNYTITTTSQLLSVPYAKFASEAGNTFSGQYADLAGAPTVVSAFANDEGYLTTVTGSETAFNAWDKDETDDFSGNYAHLTGAPTAVSAFTNDAGYLTSASALWSQSGSNLYYLGGYIGIGTTTPVRPLTINAGASDSYGLFHTTTTGSAISDGLLIGIRPDFNAYVWNSENGPLRLGTNNLQRILIEPGGDVGIGASNPTATLEVNGDTKFGANGVRFNEMREVTGTTSDTYLVSIALPSGYNEDNTRVLSLEIQWAGTMWVGMGMNNQTSLQPVNNISYLIYGSNMYIYYPNISQLHSRAFRALIIQIAP